MSTEPELKTLSVEELKTLAHNRMASYAIGAVVQNLWQAEVDLAQKCGWISNRKALLTVLSGLCVDAGTNMVPVLRTAALEVVAELAERAAAEADVPQSS